MKVVTSPELKMELYQQMKDTFSDVSYFNDLVAVKLQQAINESDNLDLSFSNVKGFAKRFYETGRYETEEERKRWKEIQWIFATCCVLIVSRQDRTMKHFWTKTEILLAHYPSFASIADTDEIKLLLKFRNMLVAACLVLNPRLNKELIIYVAGRLEGTQRRYITGKGQRDAVSMRVRIYEKEGRVTPEVRPYRAIQSSNPEKVAAAAAKRQASNPSMPKKKRAEVDRIMQFNAAGNLKSAPNTAQIVEPENVGNPHLAPLINAALQKVTTQRFVLSIDEQERLNFVGNFSGNQQQGNAENIQYLPSAAAGSSDKEINLEEKFRLTKSLLMSAGGPDSKVSSEASVPSTVFDSSIQGLLQCAQVTEHEGADPDSLFPSPNLYATPNVPFPSLSMSSHGSYFGTKYSGSGFSQGVGSGQNQNFGTAFGQKFGVFRPGVVDTDVLLTPYDPAAPSYSYEWQKYLPPTGVRGAGYVSAFANPADDQHPYLLQPQRSDGSALDLSGYSDLHALSAVAAALSETPDGDNTPVFWS